MTCHVTTVLLLSIPSPSEGVWHLGPLPLRGYALCIIAGIVAAIWIGERRWVARGGTRGRGHRPRALGGAVRHRRRPALPRDHRPPTSTSASGGNPVERALRLARRPRDLGCDRARRRRRAGSAAGGKASAAARARRARARRAGRPGHRPLGQLVQPGALRQAHDLPWGLEIDPALPARRLPSESRPSTRRSSTSSLWDLRRLRRAALGRPPLPARPRPGVRALRHGLHRSAAAGSRCCGSTPCSSTTSSACASTSGPRSCCSSWRAGVLRLVRPASASRPRGDGLRREPARDARSADAGRPTAPIRGRRRRDRADDVDATGVA